MNIKELKEFAENTPLITHNAQFEHSWFLSRSIEADIKHDTMLAAYLYDERLPLSLESLCLKFDIDRVFKKEYGKDVANMSDERMKERNTKDARNTYLLMAKLWSLLSEEEKRVYKTVLIPATRSLAQIENTGVCYSPKVLKDVVQELKDRAEELKLYEDPFIKKFNENSKKEFNIDSWMHRLVVIYDMLGYEELPYRKGKTDPEDPESNPTTGVKVLKRLLDRRYTETLEKIIKYSSYHGWQENYEALEAYCDKCGHSHTDKIGDSSFVFTNLYLGDTTTGRIKSTHPNMQNNPRREGGWTRRCFVPRSPNGVILEADYDQIELKVIAGLSGDEPLIDAFLNGDDLHKDMARIAFALNSVDEVTKELREDGKTLNYALPFGAGIDRIAFETNREHWEVKKWRTRFWKEHPTLDFYLKNVPERGIIKSPTGMKRHCTTWTQAKNFPIQNTALIVLLLALNRLAKDSILWKAPVDLAIHDSLRFDVEDISLVPRVSMKIKEAMEFAPYEVFSWMPIPFTVSFKIGRDWGNMKDYEPGTEVIL